MDKIDKMSFDEFLDVITAQPVQFWACPICDGSRVKWDKGIATCLNCLRASNTVSPDSGAASVITSTVTKWYYLPKVPEIGVSVVVAGVFVGIIKDKLDRIKAFYIGNGKWKGQASDKEIPNWIFPIYAWTYERLPVAPPLPEATQGDDETMSNQIKPRVFTIKIRLSSSQASEHSKKAKALGYKNFRDYANNRTNILTEELIQEYGYHIQEQARALLKSCPTAPSPEAYQPPDSAAVVSVVDSVPSGKEIWGYNEKRELVSEAGFKFLVTDSEGANEGTVTISPGDGEVKPIKLVEGLYFSQPPQTASESLQLVAYDTAIIASITLLLNAHHYK